MKKIIIIPVCLNPLLFFTPQNSYSQILLTPPSAAEILHLDIVFGKELERMSIDVAGSTIDNDIKISFVEAVKHIKESPLNGEKLSHLFDLADDIFETHPELATRVFSALLRNGQEWVCRTAATKLMNITTFEALEQLMSCDKDPKPLQHELAQLGMLHIMTELNRKIEPFTKFIAMECVPYKLINSQNYSN